MGDDVTKIRDTYQERARTSSTLSGIEIKELYRPDDIKDIRYDRDIADSGRYPYTRGIYPNMFRGRYWTRREVCCQGQKSAQNEHFS